MGQNAGCGGKVFVAGCHKMWRVERKGLAKRILDQKHRKADVIDPGGIFYDKNTRREILSSLILFKSRNKWYG